MSLWSKSNGKPITLLPRTNVSVLYVAYVHVNIPQSLLFVCCGTVFPKLVWSGCNRCTRLAKIRSCRVARRSQTTSRPATTVSGNSFSVNYFFLFSFSHRENAFRLLRIARRSTCRTEEAGGKTCALWYGPVATGVPVLQWSALVVLRIVCKRRFGQQHHSRGKEPIFFFHLDTSLS